MTPPVDPTIVLASSDSTSSNQAVDSTHPYHLTASDSPGMNLVNVTFDGTSYGNWKRGVLISLSAKNKLSFINPKTEIPTETSPLYGQWQSKDISESVIYSQTTAELWSELEEKYGQPDGSKLFQLQRDLNNISQGTSDVASYFTKLKRIWDQLKVLNTFVTCTCECKCGAKAHNQKNNEDMKLIQFLMGLNDAYSATKGNILMMKPLPTAAQAYSIVLHQESQKQVHSGIHVSTDSSPFHSTVGFKHPNQSTKNWGEERGNNGYRGNAQSYTQTYAGKNNLFCIYCKRTNHVRDKCYRLIGFPEDFKFTNPKSKKSQNAKVNAVRTDEAAGSGAQAFATKTVSDIFNSKAFTKEQLDHLAQMLQSLHSGNSQEASANLAGILVALHIFSNCSRTPGS
ncbi:uncharacterized protein LOC132639226 [Lycium barbarum]|uniref:uncharacterized protein LOC132639226 n=1 Tax=Lycium barbarum TaxID=112863 RepID=UPI00293E43ED|nr:uncharacterized protein LOC132639226 [Lycium barbarum]